MTDLTIPETRIEELIALGLSLPKRLGDGPNYIDLSVALEELGFISTAEIRNEAEKGILAHFDANRSYIRHKLEEAGFNVQPTTAS